MPAFLVKEGGYPLLAISLALALSGLPVGVMGSDATLITRLGSQYLADGVWSGRCRRRVSVLMAVVVR